MVSRQAGGMWGEGSRRLMPCPPAWLSSLPPLHPALPVPSQGRPLPGAPWRGRARDQASRLAEGPRPSNPACHLEGNTGPDMDQTVSRGWFYLRAPSCTQQQVTGRAEPGRHYMPRLRLVWPRLNRLSSHGVPSNCSVATPLAPVQ